ncbi:MFS transporter [Paenibacillus sp. BC26]|uniref:MFS transporter n=1 Tax=Paenibacillus sp. BC26 TaxID=1881032 RepID=UPI0008F22108|nr:MFS transporter [Paenibacillus sp. BC26]SFS49949.1 MFS transporter, PPP family, 3-phenylpropionic acid transporter [Paenibacillus sp. BC26]
MKSPANLRIFNFLYFALLAMFISFLPVYLDAQGLTATKIGFIIGTGGFVSLFASPLWGMVSDRSKTIRKVLLVLIFCSTIVGYMLYASGSFILLVVFTMLLYFFLLSMDPLTESLNFQTAEARGVSYGSIRTFGALGYAVMSLAVGYVMKYFGVDGMAPLFAVIGVISFIVCFTLADAPAASKPVKLKKLGQFLTHRETLMFLILIFIAAVPSRINDTYLGVYLRELGGGPELIGQAWFLAAGTEILVFALSFWWMRKGRELALIAFASLFYFVRFFLSAWITDPHLLAYLQVLQIFTFPIFYTAAIQYLYRIVPEEWRATGQTVLALLFFGVSGIVASYAGGWLYESVTGHTYYLIIAGLSFCALLFSLVLLSIYGKKEHGGRQGIPASSAE